LNFDIVPTRPSSGTVGLNESGVLGSAGESSEGATVERQLPEAGPMSAIGAF
jgi:hypothetical protein